MAGYTKLFSRILDSTIWREDSDTKVLWITMLAMADQDGVVHATIPGLADRARVSIEKCEEALGRFQQPDKYSWSTEESGRRVRVVEGGWFLINHAKYRALMGYEEQKEKTRQRVARHRAHKLEALQTVTDVTGNDCNDIHKHKHKHKHKHIQIQEVKTVIESTTPDWVPLGTWSDFVEMRKKIRKPLTDKARILAWTLLAKLMAEGNDPTEVLNQSILNNWAGLFPVGDRRNGNGASPSKAEQLVNKNRAAIIDGLGLGAPSR